MRCRKWRGGGGIGPWRNHDCEGYFNSVGGDWNESLQPEATTNFGGGLRSALYLVDDVHQARNDKGVGQWMMESRKDKGIGIFLPYTLSRLAP